MWEGSSRSIYKRQCGPPYVESVKMSEKEEPQLSLLLKSTQSLRKTKNCRNSTATTSPEKLESSAGTLASPDEQGGFVSRSPAFERRLLRKIDWHLVTGVALLYWLLNLSESQFGKARLFGLETDLHMTNIDFNIAAVMFSIPHILFAIPSNILLRLVKPRTWLPSISYYIADSNCSADAGGGIDYNGYRLDTEFRRSNCVSRGPGASRIWRISGLHVHVVHVVPTE